MDGSGGGRWLSLFASSSSYTSSFALWRLSCVASRHWRHHTRGGRVGWWALAIIVRTFAQLYQFIRFVAFEWGSVTALATSHLTMGGLGGGRRLSHFDTPATVFHVTPFGGRVRGWVSGGVYSRMASPVTSYYRGWAGSRHHTSHTTPWWVG